MYRDVQGNAIFIRQRDLYIIVAVDRISDKSLHARTRAKSAAVTPNARRDLYFHVSRPLRMSGDRMALVPHRETTLAGVVIAYNCV